MERFLAVSLVVIRYELPQDSPIPCFFNVCPHGQDEPERVVIEIRPYVPVSEFSERLVLVVSAAVLLLSGCQVQDSLTGSGGDQLYESQQVLVRVARKQNAIG